jgi:hypothetical protein
MTMTMKDLRIMVGIPISLSCNVLLFFLLIFLGGLDGGDRRIYVRVQEKKVWGL